MKEGGGSVVGEGTESGARRWRWHDERGGGCVMATVDSGESERGGEGMSRPGFYNQVSEGIRQANPVLVTNYFKEKFY